MRRTASASGLWAPKSVDFGGKSARSRAGPLPLVRNFRIGPQGEALCSLRILGYYIPQYWHGT